MQKLSNVQTEIIGQKIKSYQTNQNSVETLNMIALNQKAWYRQAHVTNHILHNVLLEGVSLYTVWE